MTLQQFLNALYAIETVDIRDTRGVQIPQHFHITEVGKTTRESIDCGGHPHKTVKATIQLYAANDIDHRLAPGKVISILQSTAQDLGLGDEEVEVEYQIDDNTVGLYGLEHINRKFYLTQRHTDCLAKEECGIPTAVLSDGADEGACCSPGSGCC